MRTKLTAAFLGLAFCFMAHCQVQAAEVDLSSIAKLPASAQKAIYESAIEMNQDVEKELAAIGMANMSLQDAIKANLDQYIDKGAPIPVYNFPADKVGEISKLLEQHEDATDRMEKLNKRIKKIKDMVASLKHNLSELEGR